MKKQNVCKYFFAVALLLMFTAGLAAQSGRKPMYMNMQKLVLYHSKKTNEYYLAAYSTDKSTSLGNLDTMNVHVLLEMGDSVKKMIDNEDLKIACLGNMYNKVIGEKTTLFRFNLVIDNSGSIDLPSLSHVQSTLKKFIELIPLVFEAQIIRFSGDIQLKTKFTKDKQELINAVTQQQPQGGTALYDAIDIAVQEIKYLGDEVPLRFSVILTDGKDTASRRNTDPNLFKDKIKNECRKHFMPLFIVGVTDDVNSALLSEIAGFGLYQHIRDFPDLDQAFQVILNLIKDTYVFKIPAVGNFSDIKTIYLVKKTPAGNTETIQDFIVH